MKRILFNVRLLMLATALSVLELGCAGTGSRVPPPASSFEQLMAPSVSIPGGTTGTNSSAPVAGANGAPAASPTPSNPGAAGFAAPTGGVAAPEKGTPAPSTGNNGRSRIQLQPIDPSRETNGSTNRKPSEDPLGGTIIRGQNPGPNGYQPPVGYQPNGYQQPAPGFSPGVPVQNGPAFGGGVANPAANNFNNAPNNGQPFANGQPVNPQGGALPPPPGYGPWPPQSYISPNPDQIIQAQPTPLDVYVEETRTGRFMFGVGVNSDAGVTGQITVDERNFDITKPPTSFDDFLNGTAWRGAGQGFRLEAQPGNRVQRYLASFTEPYLFNTQVSMNASGFYFDRSYFDWTESRLGGRLGFGYRLTPDLSATAAIRAEDVFVHNPRLLVVPALNRSLGHSDVFSGKFALTHDTRDLPFMPTEGHMINVSYEQVFGEFDFPRFEADYSQYYMLKERPDGSGRHTLALTLKFGIMGADAPIFEHYFAGGFSSMRGFSFRGMGPIDTTVRVGGRMQAIGSLEYFFPLTADDMIKGVAFCDFGAVEEELKFAKDDFRVAPGFGLRVNVPALGPAPLAFDFAFPVAYQNSDDRQVFSFYVGFARQ